MATDSTVTEEEIIEDDVESPQGEDEIVESDASEGGEQEEETVEEAEPSFEKRFTQFKGDTPEEYLKNLEDAYGHSYAEITRVKEGSRESQAKLDQIMANVARDPELAEKLQLQAQPTTPTVPTAPTAPAAPPVDPILGYARQQVQQQWEKEYHDFVGEHQELQTDQDLNAKVIQTLQTVSTTMQQTQGRLPGMTEGLKMAWQILGYPLNDSEETTRMAVKTAAAQSKTSTGRPTAPPAKQRFTKAQLDFAKRAYPEKNEGELTKILEEHAA